MWFFHQTSPATRVSLAYITIGSLIVVWSAVWFVFVFNNPPTSNHNYYWVTGSLISGLTLLTIGFSLGRIGRASRGAETPASQVPPPSVPAATVAAPLAAVGPPIAPMQPTAVPVPQPSYQVPGTIPAQGR